MVDIHVNVVEVVTWRVDGAKTDWEDRALDFLQSIVDCLFLLEIGYVMRRSTLANHGVAVRFQSQLEDGAAGSPNAYPWMKFIVRAAGIERAVGR